MHVSGISVGNPKTEAEFTQNDGTVKKEKIIGTAPEAQLIFYGCFPRSNNLYSYVCKSC